MELVIAGEVAVGVACQAVGVAAGVAAGAQAAEVVPIAMTEWFSKVEMGSLGCP